MKVNKAVIPAAGLGTRFPPQTKAMPKEMLPIIDKPIMQYVVEEAVSEGITDIIIVTGSHKRAIEDHFDHQYELEDRLDRQGKTAMAEQLRQIADMANFIYVRQKGQYGNGTPILNVAHLLGNEPFSVGGYILTTEIIAFLEQQILDKPGEIYLSLAIDKLAQQSDVFGKVIEGTWHDTGDKRRYLEAIVNVALADPELGPEFRNYLSAQLNQEP